MTGSTTEADRLLADLSPEDRDFSIVLGGPLYQFFRRTGMADDAMELIRRRIVVLSLFAWLPLLLLSLAEGALVDGGLALPFLEDVQTHVRFLVAVPLLVAAEMIVHRRFLPLVIQFLERDLVAGPDMQRFKAAIDSARRLRNSMTAEIVIIALIYMVGILFSRKFVVLDVASWYAVPVGEGHRTSFAGLWYDYVSLPLFQFLLFRWYFRIFIWARFLWQVSRIRLQLMPTHPDRAGGLGFLTGTAYAFVPLLMAHGALLAGMIADRIFLMGESLPDFRLEVIILVIFLLCLVQGPLLVLSPQLAAAKRKAKREYGRFAQGYVRQFDAKWLRGGTAPDEPLMGSADIQSLADLGNAYEAVQSMQIWLISSRSILTFAGAIVAPIVPLGLTMMPLEALLDRLFGVLF